MPHHAHKVRRHDRCRRSANSAPKSRRMAKGAASTRRGSAIHTPSAHASSSTSPSLSEHGPCGKDIDGPCSPLVLVVEPDDMAGGLPTHELCVGCHGRLARPCGLTGRQAARTTHNTKADRPLVLRQSSNDRLGATGRLSASAGTSRHMGWQAARGTRQSKIDGTLGCRTPPPSLYPLSRVAPVFPFPHFRVDRPAEWALRSAVIASGVRLGKIEKLANIIALLRVLGSSARGARPRPPLAGTSEPPRRVEG
jgi:hypothetical protein